MAIVDSGFYDAVLVHLTRVLLIVVPGGALWNIDLNSSRVYCCAVGPEPILLLAMPCIFQKVTLHLLRTGHVTITIYVQSRAPMFSISYLPGHRCH